MLVDFVFALVCSALIYDNLLAGDGQRKNVKWVLVGKRREVKVLAEKLYRGGVQPSKIAQHALVEYRKLGVVFSYQLRDPAAANMIPPFDVFVEPHGCAILQFVGRTFPTSSPSPPISTLLSGLSCRCSCKVLDPNTLKDSGTVDTPPSDVFDV